ncbi:MAG TPA: acyl-CoA dehydrogenase family protein, partial [Planctomycetota bacterium]|nr:acyl-CoA dehydrogenase family protein [Planctomycetota bacterium]
MDRRIDHYLRNLVDEDRFSFYGEVHRFASESVAKDLLKWSREHVLLPDRVIREMGDMGLFGLTVEEEFGGQGGSQIDLVLAGLSLGYYSHSVAITPGAATSLGTKPIQIFGSAQQKKAHLPDLAQGKRMFVFGLSEPGRGSDAANPEVTAVRDGDSW